MMEKFSLQTEKVFCKIIVGISFLVVVFLTLQAFSVKVRMGITERADFSAQDWWQYVLVLMVFFPFLLMVKKPAKKIRPIWCNKKNLTVLLMIVTALYTVAMIAIVLLMQVEPRADQQIVLQVAGQFAKGDYSAWNKGQYCDMYTNQDGMILLFSILSKVWGANHWMACQIVNVFLIILAAWGMKQIMYFLFSDDVLALLTYLSLLLFMPLNGYVTFVYGTLPGLACAVWGSWLVLVSCREHAVGKGVAGAVLLAVSCLLKNNYQIVLIAVCLVVFCDFIKKRKAFLILLFSFLVLASLLLSYGAKTYINIKTNASSERGIPSMAWVAMGLQKEGTKAVGWYNGYTKKVYAENGFEKKKANAQAKKEIKESLSEMLSNKQEACKFFWEKTASQWNEATFESVWINQLRHENTDMPGWIKSLLTDGSFLQKLYVKICDISLFLIWAGLLLFLWKIRKTDDIRIFIWIIAFLGGFCFHLFWEAKGQYTLIYVWLCIPYAIRGYQLWTRGVTEKIAEKRDEPA